LPAFARHLSAAGAGHAGHSFPFERFAMPNMVSSQKNIKRYRGRVHP
jgi:hypothetical protein